MEERVPEEYLCTCCLEVLLNPVSLPCGHTFCQPCLVQWIQSAKRCHCLVCRQTFHDKPYLNVSLDASIKRHYPLHVERRRDRLSSAEAAISGEAYRGALDQAVAACGAEDTDRGRDLILAFILGGIVIGVLFAGGWLLLHLISGTLTFGWGEGKPLLGAKPSAQWSPAEVQAWLRGLGDWAEAYAEMSERQAVDGRILLSLSKASIRTILEDRTKQTVLGTETPDDAVASLRADSLATAIDTLREAGSAPPSDLWELKAARLVDVVFYAFALHHVPRLTLVYMYVFDYKLSFVPLFRSAGLYSLAACAEQNAKYSADDETVCVASEGQYLWYEGAEDLSWYEFVKFWMTALVLPYVTLGHMAWVWSGVHPWVSLSACLLLLVCWARELTAQIGNVRGGGRTAVMSAVVWASTSSALLLFYLLLSQLRYVVPWFVWNGIFYLEFLLSPFFHICDMVKTLRDVRH